jgi:hypothetical protein
MGLTAFALKTVKTEELRATDNSVMMFPPDMTLSLAEPQR